MTQINQLSAIENPSGGDQLPLYSTNNGDARKMALSVLASWLADGTLSNLDLAGYVKVAPVTVANLPSAASAGTGAKAFVTDATSNSFHAVVSGGGSNQVPVFVDGAQWRIG